MLIGLIDSKENLSRVNESKSHLDFLKEKEKEKII